MQGEALPQAPRESVNVRIKRYERRILVMDGSGRGVLATEPTDRRSDLFHSVLRLCGFAKVVLGSHEANQHAGLADFPRRWVAVSRQKREQGEFQCLNMGMTPGDSTSPS
jgi:hypothetical protein